MESMENEDTRLETIDDEGEGMEEIDIKMESKSEEVVNEESNELVAKKEANEMEINDEERGKDIEINDKEKEENLKKDNVKNIVNEEIVIDKDVNAVDVNVVINDIDDDNIVDDNMDNDDEVGLVEEEFIEKDENEEDKDLEWMQMEIPEEWKPLPILLVKKIPKDCTEERLRNSFSDVGISVRSITFNTINESPGFIKAYVRLHPMPIPWERDEIEDGKIDDKCESVMEGEELKEMDSWERAKYIAEKLNKEKSLKINEKILYIEANEERVIMYITHLSKELQSDRKLREVMSKFGKVERCFVIKNRLGESKDYAFVEFSLPHIALKVKDILDKEAADGFSRILRNRNQDFFPTLHDNINNSELNEKKELKINVDSKKNENEEENENEVKVEEKNEIDECKDDVKEEEEEEELRGNVEVKMDHDYDQLAKLLYDNESSNDKNLKNKIIRAEWAWPTTIASLFSKLLYVSNLSVEAYTYTSKTKKILDEYGKLIHLNVMRSKITIHEKAFAFIEYRKFSEADKAFRILNETEHDFLGFPIIAFVNPAKISIEKRHAVRYVQTRDRLYELSPQPRFSVQGNNRLTYGNTILYLVL